MFGFVIEVCRKVLHYTGKWGLLEQMHTRMDTNTRARARAPNNMHTLHIHMHKHIHAQTHTHAHTCTHTLSGEFYPGTGAAQEVGTGPGRGYTVNVAWESGGIQNGDYLAAFTHLLLPIAYEVSSVGVRNVSVGLGCEGVGVCVCMKNEYVQKKLHCPPPSSFLLYKTSIQKVLKFPVLTGKIINTHAWKLESTRMT
jgi:hypothetical protein